MEQIRCAAISDSGILTDISFRSKGYWNYPETYFETWKKELTITEEYLSQNPVHIIERDGLPLGYYSIFHLKEDIRFSGVLIHRGTWLEHMFIDPDHIGKGIGAKLFAHMKTAFREYKTINILADPNARGFYERMGCTYEREYPSSIEGRTTPYLTIRVS